MSDMQLIKDEIDKIKLLRDNYDNLAINPNSYEAIEAYHKWYEESIVIFSHHFDNQTNEYVNFKNINNNDANGYVLKNNYQKIRKDFCVLLHCCPEKISQNSYYQLILN